MGIVFIDSFDQRAIGTKYESYDDSFLSYGTVRTGSGVYQSQPGQNNMVRKTITATGTIVLGWAFWLGSGTFTTACKIAKVLDAGTVHLYLQVNTDKTLSVYRGDNTLLGTSTSAIPQGGDFATYGIYIEWKSVIHDSTGTTEVKVNGTATGWISLTGQDTKNSANATANQGQIGFEDGAGTFTASWDDFYIADDTYYGALKIERLNPNGNGNSSQWTGSDGNQTDNYLLVDESTDFDSDTTYVLSSASGNVDTYAFPSMAASAGNIKAVQISWVAKKTDVTTVGLSPVVRHSGTDYVGTEQNITTSYAYYRQMYETNPGTAAAWTFQNITDAEFGIKQTT